MERLTYLNENEEYLKLLLNSPIEQTRIFLLILNHIQVKNKTVKNDGDNYGGIEYFKDKKNIYVPFTDLKKVIKQKYSYDDIICLIENTLYTFEEYICFYKFEDDLLYIEFTDNSILYSDRFIIIDLSVICELRSKYELFVYFKIMQFQKTREAITGINEIRELLNTNAESREILRKINKAVAKLNTILFINITVTVKRNKRSASSIKLNF